MTSRFPWRSAAGTKAEAVSHTAWARSKASGPQGGFLVQAGQVYQLAHQVRQAAVSSFMSESQGFVGPRPLQDVQVRLEEGEGRFQLVAGVGDELPLALVALHRRPHRPFGEHHHQQQGRQTARPEHQARRHEEGPVGVQHQCPADAHHGGPPFQTPTP